MSRYAAIDIGSNSIRMLVADAHPAPFHELAVDRQVVRLGEGVFRDGKLTQQSMTASLEVLRRMSEKIAASDVMAMRAVGTSALRDALNRTEFLDRASEILKTPIEVITGLEEARLIHMGVQLRWPHPKHRLLILDIGGGSAELILSENGVFEQAISKPLGAVRLTEMFLESDPADPRELVRLENFVRERLTSAPQRFNAGKVHRMIATSSTASAITCAANQIPRNRRDSADRMRVTAAQARTLYHELARRTKAARAKMIGIGPRRSEIIVAGAAVLHTVMREFELPSFCYSTAGLRDGIIADLVHRKVGLEQARLDPDQRRMVREMVAKYGMNPRHVRKVADLAHVLFDGLRDVHQLPLRQGKLLDAAAYLYNIGHFVNEARHHRHSMYIVANSDMPGFSAEERMVIANLCRYHRKSTPQLTHESFSIVGCGRSAGGDVAAPLLRLAVALDQSQEQNVERVETSVQEQSFEVRLYSDKDVDIEQWSAQQVAEVFRGIYGRTLTVRVKR